MPSPCEMVESWELAVVHGSCSVCPRESGCFCSCGERYGMSFPEHQCCVVSSSPTSLPVLLVNLLLMHFLIWQETARGLVFFVKGFARRLQPGNFQHNRTHRTREVILESGKGETPGDTECPQLCLESAGLRSLIPREGSQAQSRYSFIERCPAEKDYGFS